jgi:hypothetical protein
MEKEEEEKKSDEVITREQRKLEGYRSREPRGDDDEDSDNDGDKKE